MTVADAEANDKTDAVRYLMEVTLRAWTIRDSNPGWGNRYFSFLTRSDVFERRILRKKISGPVQNEDGSLRIGMNYELNELTENANDSGIYKKQMNSLTGSRDAGG